MSILNFGSLRKMVAPPDLAIDLGTANTRLFARGRGLIVDEPSLIKLEPHTHAVEAFGLTAAKLASVDPQSFFFSPLHAGVVTDVDAAGALLRAFLNRFRHLGFMPQRALACIPTALAEVEREALLEAAERAGLTEVATVPKPLAAAIGAGLDVSSAYAQLIVEVGAGITEAAVVRSGELLETCTLRVACGDLHRAVSQNVASRYGVLLFPREAERLTQEIGIANQTDANREFITTGTDLLSGRSVCLSVTSYDVLFAAESVVELIVDKLAAFVEMLPPELACEVIEGGIYLTGGGALIKGLPERLSLATQLDLTIAYDPMRAVIRGAQEMLQVSEKTGVWAH
ncbi:MAG: rod shape-determining protein [Acidobacteria bacterium]|nr:rod shape-determining protein [Acidobacteriota bacterium]MBI3424206.1 rod shape-determining protein [Acidobacteriota bacterium]